MAVAYIPLAANMSQFTSESQFQAYTANLLRKEHLLSFLREMNLWQTIETIGQQFHDDIKRNGDSYRLAPLTITLNFDMSQVANVSGIQEISSCRDCFIILSIYFFLSTIL